eukprot:1161469-Pelagomonas_calceolata.AAC.35
MAVLRAAGNLKRKLPDMAEVRISIGAVSSSSIAGIFQQRHVLEREYQVCNLPWKSAMLSKLFFGLYKEQACCWVMRATQGAMPWRAAVLHVRSALICTESKLAVADEGGMLAGVLAVNSQQTQLNTH